jgi:hypothetical protein
VLKRISAVTTAGAAAIALAVGLSATPSSATTASTWTVEPGGSVTASGSLHLKDTKTSTVSPCTSIKLATTLKSGSGLVGTDIGSIASATFTRCYLDGIYGQFSVTVNGLPWKLTAKSYNSGVTTGTVTGIDLTVETTGCVATLDGTAAGQDNGTIKFTYTNSTGKLKLLPAGGNLHWWSVSGCLGLIDSGDPVQPSGTLTVTPQQTITSP